MPLENLTRVGDVIYEIGRGHRSDMQVPVRVIAAPELLSAIAADRSIDQLLNVATLPGITRFATGIAGHA